MPRVALFCDADSLRDRRGQHVQSQQLEYAEAMGYFLAFLATGILYEVASIVWGLFKVGSAVARDLSSGAAQRASSRKERVDATAEVESEARRVERSVVPTEARVSPSVRKEHRCERCGRTWPWDGSRQGDDRCFACGWIPPAFRR